MQQRPVVHANPFICITLGLHRDHAINIVLYITFQLDIPIDNNMCGCSHMLSLHNFKDVSCIWFVPPCALSWFSTGWLKQYRQTSNISGTLVGNEIVDHSDRLSPLLQLYLYSRLNTWLQCNRQYCKTRRETFNFWDLMHLISNDWRYPSGLIHWPLYSHTVTLT